jgi:hypothetical protein
MSRAGPRAERAPLDFYATPDPLALAICERLRLRLADVPAPRYVVEPSAGTGAFVRAIRKTWPAARVRAVEVDPALALPLSIADADIVYTADWPQHAADAVDGGAPPPDLILGNPPYRQAQEHIEAGLRWLAPGGRLAFLLRLNFLGSAARVDFWRRGELESVSTIAPRPSFTGDGKTDGTEYALFVWRKGHIDRPVLGEPLTWEKGIRASSVSLSSDEGRSNGGKEEAA